MHVSGNSNLCADSRNQTHEGSGKGPQTAKNLCQHVILQHCLLPRLALAQQPGDCDSVVESHQGNDTAWAGVLHVHPSISGCLLLLREIPAIFGRIRPYLMTCSHTVLRCCPMLSEITIMFPNFSQCEGATVFGALTKEEQGITRRSCTQI